MLSKWCWHCPADPYPWLTWIIHAQQFSWSAQTRTRRCPLLKMAVSSHLMHFKAVRICARLVYIKALSKTPMCQFNSMLELSESSWFRYAFIAIDDFFITDSVSKQGGSELDSSTDSKDKVFTVGWFGWVALLGIVTPMRPVVSVFLLLPVP